MDFLAQQVVNGLILGSVYALYAAGFGLVMGNLKVFHVAHAAVFTWGAVFAWQLTNGWGLSLLAALPIVMVMAGLLNAAAYFILIRHVMNRADHELAAFVSSLGGLIVLDQLAYHFLGGSVVRMPPEAFSGTALKLGPVRFTTLHVLMVVVAIALIVILNYAVKHSNAGRQLRAIASDRPTASLLGVDVHRVSSGVFFVGGALGGLAAAFIAMAFNVVNADLGSAYLVIALAAMVVGGFGSVIGMLAGGTLIGLASTLVTGYMAGSYRDLVIFGLLLLFLVFRPEGLFRTNDNLTRV